MVDIASTTARRQVHGSWGAGKLAGRLTKHGIDMDGDDEAPEAVTEDVAAQPSLPGCCSALRRSAKLRGTQRARRRELL